MLRPRKVLSLYLLLSLSFSSTLSTTTGTNFPSFGRKLIPSHPLIIIPILTDKIRNEIKKKKESRSSPTFLQDFFKNLTSSEHFNALTDSTVNSYHYDLEHQVLLPYYRILHSKRVSGDIPSISFLRRFSLPQLQALLIGTGGVVPLCSLEVLQSKANLRLFKQILIAANYSLPLYRDCVTGPLSNTSYFRILHDYLRPEWLAHIKQYSKAVVTIDEKTALSLLSSSNLPFLYHNRLWEAEDLRQFYRFAASLDKVRVMKNDLRFPSVVFTSKVSNREALEEELKRRALDIRESGTGKTPLHYALSSKNPIIKDRIMSHKSFTSLINMTDDNGNNALMDLIMQHGYLSDVSDKKRDYALANLLQDSRHMISNKEFNFLSKNKKKETIFDLIIDTNLVPLLHLFFSYYKINERILLQMVIQSIEKQKDRITNYLIIHRKFTQEALDIIKKQYPSYYINNLKSVKDITDLQTLIYQREVNVDINDTNIDVCEAINKALDSYNSLHLIYLLRLKNRKCESSSSSSTTTTSTTNKEYTRSGVSLTTTAVTIQSLTPVDTLSTSREYSKTVQKKGHLVYAMSLMNITGVFILASEGYKLNQYYNHAPLLHYVLQKQSLFLLQVVLDFKQIPLHSLSTLTLPNDERSMLITDYLDNYYSKGALIIVKKYYDSSAVSAKDAYVEAIANKHPYDTYVNSSILTTVTTSQVSYDSIMKENSDVKKALDNIKHTSSATVTTTMSLLFELSEEDLKCDRQSKDGEPFKLYTVRSHEAIRTEEVIESITHSHCNVDIINERDSSRLLHHINGNEELLLFLLSQGSNTNIFYNMDSFIVSQYVQWLFTRITVKHQILSLLLKNGLDIYLTNTEGNTLLHLLLCDSRVMPFLEESQLTDIARLLFPVRQIRNFYGETAMRCLIKADAPLSTLLIFQVAGYDMLDFDGTNTLLTNAREQGRLISYKALLELDVDLFYPPKGGLNEFSASFRAPTDDTCHAYLDRVMEKSLSVPEEVLVDAVVVAVEGRKKECLQRMRGLVNAFRETSQGEILYNFILRKGWDDLILSIDVCQAVEEKVFYVNSRNSSDGNSALIVATEKGRRQMIETLLSCEADPFLQNSQGQSALSVAMRGEDKTIGTMLLAFIQAKKLSFKDSFDFHLSQAIAKNRMDIIDTLLSSISSPFVDGNVQGENNLPASPALLDLGECNNRCSLTLSLSACAKSVPCGEIFGRILDSSPSPSSLFIRLFSEAVEANNRLPIQVLHNYGLSFDSSNEGILSNALFLSARSISSQELYSNTTLSLLLTLFPFPRSIPDIGEKLLQTLIKAQLPSIIKAIPQSQWESYLSLSPLSSPHQLFYDLVQMNDVTLLESFYSLGIFTFAPSPLSFSILDYAIRNHYVSLLQYLEQISLPFPPESHSSFTLQLYTKAVKTRNSSVINSVLSNQSLSYQNDRSLIDEILKEAMIHEKTLYLWGSLSLLACHKGMENPECLPKTFSVLLQKGNLQALRQIISQGFRYHSNSTKAVFASLDAIASFKTADRKLQRDLFDLFLASSPSLSHLLSDLDELPRLRIVRYMTQNPETPQDIAVSLISLAYSHGDVCTHDRNGSLCNRLVKQLIDDKASSLLPALAHKGIHFSFSPNDNIVANLILRTFSQKDFKSNLESEKTREELKRLMSLALLYPIYDPSSSRVNENFSPLLIHLGKTPSKIRLTLSLLLNPLPTLDLSRLDSHFCLGLQSFVASSCSECLEEMHRLFQQKNYSFSDSCSVEENERRVSLLEWTVEKKPLMASLVEAFHVDPTEGLLIKVMKIGEADLAAKMVKKLQTLGGENEEGDTSLIYAAREDLVEVVEELVEREADCAYVNSRGTTAMEEAVKHAAHRVVEFFLRNPCFKRVREEEEEEEEEEETLIRKRRKHRYFVNLNSVNRISRESLLMIGVGNPKNDINFFNSLLSFSTPSDALSPLLSPYSFSSPFSLSSPLSLTSPSSLSSPLLGKLGSEYSPSARRRHPIDLHYENSLTGEHFILKVIREGRWDLLEHFSKDSRFSPLYNTPNHITGVTPFMSLLSLHPFSPHSHPSLSRTLPHSLTQSNPLFFAIEHHLLSPIESLLLEWKDLNILPQMILHPLTKENPLMYSLRHEQSPFPITQYLLSSPLLSSFSLSHYINPLSGKSVLHYVLQYADFSLFQSFSSLVNLSNPSTDITPLKNTLTDESLLHYAAIGTDKKIFPYLIALYGQEPSSLVTGENSVLKALSSCALDNARRIVEFAPIYLESVNEKTGLDFLGTVSAARCEPRVYEGFVEWLLRLLVKEEMMEEVCGEEGSGCGHMAVENGDMVLFAGMLREGLLRGDGENESGESLLKHAIRLRENFAVQELMKMSWVGVEIGRDVEEYAEKYSNQMALYMIRKKKRMVIV